jgi:hypothetical protein
VQQAAGKEQLAHRRRHGGGIDHDVSIDTPQQSTEPLDLTLMLADLLGHATGDAGQERRRRHLGGLGARRQSVSRRRKLVRQPLQRRISPGERHPGALTPHHLPTQLVGRIRLPDMSLAGHTFVLGVCDCGMRYADLMSRHEEWSANRTLIWRPAMDAITGPAGLTFSMEAARRTRADRSAAAQHKWAYWPRNVWPHRPARQLRRPRRHHPSSGRSCNFHSSKL